MPDKSITETRLELLYELKLAGKKLVDIFSEFKTIEFHNRFVRMSLYFSNKQTEHLASLLSWKPTHDFFLIARSMIEGVCLLTFASEDKEVRAQNWDESFFIQKRNQYFDRQRIGVKHLDGTLAQIEKDILENCVSLVSPVEQKRWTFPVNGIHYFKNWYMKFSISQILKEFGEPAYKPFWSDFSSWHHWEPNSFAEYALSTDDPKVNYHGITDFHTMTSILCGLSCTAKTMYMAFQELGQMATCKRLELVLLEADKIVSGIDWKEN